MHDVPLYTCACVGGEGVCVLCVCVCVWGGGGRFESQPDSPFFKISTAIFSKCFTATAALELWKLVSIDMII